MLSFSKLQEVARQHLGLPKPATLSNPATYVVLALLVLGLDVVTGPFLLFPIFFVLPVTGAAWFCRRRLSLALACALPLGRAVMDAHYGFPAGYAYVLANAAVRIVVLAVIAYLVSRVARQAKELARRVRVLEGLLPICAHCKRIRDGEQNWRHLESYITEHSEAHFSHSICPECTQKYYGNLFDADPKH